MDTGLILRQQEDIPDHKPKAKQLVGGKEINKKVELTYFENCPDLPVEGSGFFCENLSNLVNLCIPKIQNTPLHQHLNATPKSIQVNTVV